MNRGAIRKKKLRRRAKSRRLRLWWEGYWRGYDDQLAPEYRPSGNIIAGSGRIRPGEIGGNFARAIKRFSEMFRDGASR